MNKHNYKFIKKKRPIQNPSKTPANLEMTNSEFVCRSFVEWKTRNKAESFSDAVICAFFHERSDNVAPATLWSLRSKLKAFLQYKHRINNEEFTELVQFIKNKCIGYVPKNHSC